MATVTTTMTTAPTTGRATAGYRFSAACTGCGACLLTCPQHAIRPGRAGNPAPLYVLADRCDGCGECIEICPADAITEVKGVRR
jgi:Pyruvate/2-oxoacid:ferredoxin oxidoreductase delta subunit